MINWTPYLESVCKKYAQWWDVYTLTDVAGKMRSPNTTPLLADLRVQVVKESREEREEKTEQYGVLEGLRKYAANHLLLVGRPGSGKSTALAQLLFEESEKARVLLTDEKNQEKIEIPILLELRYCKTSIVDLILQFLKRHKLIISNNELDNILLGNTNIIPWLLFDGVNELPSDEAQSNLQEFRRQNEEIPMIFTTRDIEIGGVEQRLDILPLTKPQMDQFVHDYFPERGKQVLTQLGTRLREFGETPLLLWMLCFVFATNKDEVPSTSGLLFRKFTEIFEKKKIVKEQIEIPKLLRVFYKKQLLQHLAWVMTEGYIPTEPKLSMPKDRVQKILIEFLDGKIEHSETTALEWLEYLVNYYLIQVTSDGEGIEFCHQAIQEYYAAEVLLEKLEKKSELSDEELQWDYLNYLKWTEPFVLMLGMIEKKDDAINIIKLALSVDLMLGARLAGEVNLSFQQHSIGCISSLDINPLYKVELLGLTKSDYSINELLKLLERDESEKCWFDKTIAEALDKINSKKSIALLVKILKNPFSWTRALTFQKTLISLAQIGSNEGKKYWFHTTIAEALSKINSKKSIALLTEILKDPFSWDSDLTFQKALVSLAKIGSEEAIREMLIILGRLGKYEVNSLVSRCQWDSANILNRILRQQFIDIDILKKLSEDFDDQVREGAKYSLYVQSFGTREIIERTEKIQSSVNKNKSKYIKIDTLHSMLESSHSFIQMNAVGILSQMDESKLVPLQDNPKLLSVLISMLNEHHDFENSKIVKSLANIGLDNAIKKINSLLIEKDFLSNNNGNNFQNYIKALEAIQNKLKYYTSIPQKNNLSHSTENKTMKKIKIFLASSNELRSDREQFEIFINRKNKEYIKKGVFLELIIWEDFLDAMSATRLQDEYNKFILECDIFVSLFYTKVGKYTEEEFSKAFANFKEHGKPLIYTYFKDAPIYTSKITSEIVSLLHFKENLQELGHFHTSYTDITDLKYQFDQQLNKLLEDNKLLENNKPLNNLLPQNPTASPQSITYDFRGANIGSIAHNVQGNQQVTQINKKNHDSTT